MQCGGRSWQTGLGGRVVQARPGPWAARGLQQIWYGSGMDTEETLPKADSRTTALARETIVNVRSGKLPHPLRRINTRTVPEYALPGVGGAGDPPTDIAATAAVPLSVPYWYREERRRRAGRSGEGRARARRSSPEEPSCTSSAF